MKFAAVLPFLSAAAAAPLTDALPRGWTWVNPSDDGALQKRQPGQVLLCTLPGFAGECATIDFTIEYTCQAIPAPFTNNLGSIRPEKGALCRVTTVTNTETCDRHGDLFVENPGFTDLFSHEGKDFGHDAHHITCQKCTNCQGEGSE